MRQTSQEVDAGAVKRRLYPIRLDDTLKGKPMRTILIFLGLLALAFASAAQADGKIPVLLITGQNNHKWQATTPILEAQLIKSGRFRVTVVTTPPKEASSDAWNAFRPQFSRYRAIFCNYNGQDWPEPVQKSLEQYMARGGGLVIYHASNNPFPKWEEWHKMVGLCWQGAGFGDRITVSDEGEVKRTPKGEGPGAGHGQQHAFEMVVRDPNHPVMKGLPARWLHTKDELYHGQRGPAVNMHILASAFSATETGGTGANEPLVYTTTYGKGRVFVCLLGHDVAPTSAADCSTLLTRGAEWAATGRVTLPIAPAFGEEQK